MKIKCKNALIEIKENNYNDFLEKLNKDERSFVETFNKRENNLIETDYDLNYIAYDEIVFSKNGVWKDITNYFKDIVINF